MDSALEDRVRDAFRAWCRKEARARFSGQTDYAVRKHVDERMERFPALLLAVDTLMRSAVARTTLILSGSQPIPRTQLKCGKRRYTVEPYRLLQSGLEVLMKLGGDDRWRFPVDVVAIELAGVLDAPLALLRADVARSVSSALVDDHLVAPIKEKLAKQRELARLNAVAQLKEAFRSVGHLVTKDEVSQAWDEVLVARVMES